MHFAPQYLGGYDTSGWPTLRFDSPSNLHVPGDTPLFACRVVGSIANTITAFAHGKQGRVTERTIAIPPDELGCEGTSCGYLDGSARFVERLTAYQTCGYPGELYYLPEP